MANDSTTTNKCLICKKGTVETFHPFCSKRCANVDLFNWLKGEYVIPGEELGDQEEFDPFDETPHYPKAH